MQNAKACMDGLAWLDAMVWATPCYNTSTLDGRNGELGLHIMEGEKGGKQEIFRWCVLRWYVAKWYSQVNRASKTKEGLKKIKKIKKRQSPPSTENGTPTRAEDRYLVCDRRAR
jgi:hypothetical protein